VPASRFNDGRRGVTHIVRLLIFGRELRIVGDGDVTLAVWKIADVQAAPELDPDGVVTLTARHQPGVLRIDDSAELVALRRAGIRLPGQKAWARRHWIGVAAGLAATVVLGVLVVNSLPRWIAGTIPIAWEQSIGEPAEALMTASSSRCTGHDGLVALEGLVTRLRAAGGIEMPVTISVLDDKTVNAFTLPGGHVLVMRGLIGAVTDGPMLAGVIAHELGHVAHRDSLTLMLRAMGLTILLNSIGLGDPSGSAAGGASSLMDLAYSRAAEAAADASAIDFLTKAGLRADGLSRFFVLIPPPRAHLDRGGQAVHHHRLRLHREGTSDAIGDFGFFPDGDALGAERAAPGGEIGVGQFHRRP
jgi:Zn-dependent protease with chaperone function